MTETETRLSPEVEELEQKILAATDPVEKRILLRQLAEMTMKETRVR
jgi:hypothetical protein